jgi:hypothetical protein
MPNRLSEVRLGSWAVVGVTYEKTNDLSDTNTVAECGLPIGRYVQSRPVRVLGTESFQPSRVTEERLELDDQLLVIRRRQKTYQSNIVALHDQCER